MIVSALLKPAVTGTACKLLALSADRFDESLLAVPDLRKRLRRFLDSKGVAATDELIEEVYRGGTFPDQSGGSLYFGQIWTRQLVGCGSSAITRC